MKMSNELPDVISHASSDDRTVLASLLNTSHNDPELLRRALRSRSRTLWQKISGDEITYSELLNKVATAHGIRRRVWETVRDFERRIVRTFFGRIEQELNPSQHKAYLSATKENLHRRPGLAPQASAAASIVAAQASGFGVYQMATTVMGAASSAAGITIPFLGYMALTKAIFFAIGPLGWAALGASTLHKITKPKYSEMVAVVAWIFLVRSEVYPQRTIGSYSVTELFRKLIKAALPIGLAAALFITTNRLSDSSPVSSATPVATLVPVREKEAGSGTTRWAKASFLGFKGGESAGDTVTHASTLGLTKTSDCKARPTAAEYTDCEFMGSNSESMEASFYFGQLQRIDYNFGIGRYDEILGKIKRLNGRPRILTDPHDSSFVEGEEWGDSKRKFSISLGKTADGKDGFVMFVLDPEEEHK